MIPAWAGRYVGVAFERETMNCWSLVRLVFLMERGIELPPYDDVSLDDARAIVRAMGGTPRAPHRRVQPEEMEAFDVVIMHARSEGRRLPLHAGVAVSRRHVLHVDASHPSVIVPLSHPSIARRIAGVFRYEGKR